MQLQTRYARVREWGFKYKSLTVSRGIQLMSTKTHDDLIKEAVRWAKSLGYEVFEQHLGTETGADAVFLNHLEDKVILEVVTGSSFKKLFRKPRIREALEKDMEYDWVPEVLGLIVVGDRIDNVKKHGVEAGLPDELFDPPTQRIFAVLVRDFKEVIPVLLVSILGSKASAYAREHSDDV